MPRRQDLADAAISTLAREGMRGLTHRAVDRAAGVAEGSTSYYFRTRDALLHGILQRLAEQTAETLATVPLPSNEGRPATDEQLDRLARSVVVIMEEWLTVDRDRQLARYELALEANRRPALRGLLNESGARLIDLVTAQLGAVGADPSPLRAAELVACLNGLLFDRLAGAGARDGGPESLYPAVRSLLGAAVRG